MAWVAPTRALEVDRRDFTLRVWRKRNSIYEVERAYRVAVAGLRGLQRRDRNKGGWPGRRMSDSPSMS